MTTDTIISLGGISLPLGTTAAETFGHLTSEVKLAPIRFSFDYNQVRFNCACDECDDGTISVRLTGRLGAVPFTAQSVEARKAITTIAAFAKRDLGGSVQVINGYVVTQYRKALPRPLTATALLSTLIGFLVPLRPYLALMGEVIDFPLSGRNSVRPGWRKG